MAPERKNAFVLFSHPNVIRTLTFTNNRRRANIRRAKRAQQIHFNRVGKQSKSGRDTPTQRRHQISKSRSSETTGPIWTKFFTGYPTFRRPTRCRRAHLRLANRFEQGVATAEKKSVKNKGSFWRPNNSKSKSASGKPTTASERARSKCRGIGSSRFFRKSLRGDNMRRKSKTCQKFDC